MGYELIIAPKARQDADEAIEWYDGQSVGLGLEFALAFEKTTDYVQENPFHFRQLQKQVRRANLKRFPYSVFYLVDEAHQQIAVVAVLHQKRDPEVLDERL